MPPRIWLECRYRTRGGAGAAGGGVVAEAGTHWVVRLNGRNRALFFLAMLGVLALHQWQLQVGPTMWVLQVLQFAVYPLLLYQRAVRAPDPLRAELQNLLLDGVLLGAWMAVWGLPLWISFMLAISVCLNVVIYMGMPGLMRGVVALAAGVAAVRLVAGIDFRPDTGLLVSLLCMALLTFYLLLFAQAAYQRGLSLRESRKVLGERLEQITQLQARLQEQALRDPLTGLYNRRHMDQVLDRELAACAASGEPLALVLLDIDHFKQVNDTWGHLAGDDLLRALAAQLREVVDGRAMACRLGGDELMLMLPGTSSAGAMAMAERLRRRFEQVPASTGAGPMAASLSLGIAMFPDHGQSARELLHCADQALYQAKLHGRNRTMLTEAEPAQVQACEATGHLGPV